MVHFLLQRELSWNGRIIFEAQVQSGRRKPAALYLGIWGARLNTTECRIRQTKCRLSDVLVPLLVDLA